MMSIARGVRKAAKAAKKQSRGLTGNRNSQGDFVADPGKTTVFGPEGEIDKAATGHIEVQRQAVKNFSTEELHELSFKLEEKLDEYDVLSLDDLTPEEAALYSRLTERLETVRAEIDIRFERANLPEEAKGAADLY